ncbi:MAG: YARHG domain-containing protein [Hungatella sp.]|nr:YARHG domain-containing protein [Hungatella sp.]
MICRNCQRNISNMDKICPYCNAVQVILRDKNGNIIQPEIKFAGEERKTSIPEEGIWEDIEKQDETEKNHINNKILGTKKRKKGCLLPMVLAVIMFIIWNIGKGMGSSSPSSSFSVPTAASSQETRVSQGKSEEKPKDKEESEKETRKEDHGETENQEKPQKKEEAQKTANWLNTAGIQPEYLFEDSDRRYLGEQEMEYYTAQELRLARNEIFARRGRIFQDETIAAYFSTKPWYRGTINPNKFDYDQLNACEKANVLLIQKLEETARTLIWLEDNGEWYGYDQSGAPMSGWIHNNGFCYYLERDGHMLTGYQGDSPVQEKGILTGNGYFFLADGSLYSGTVYCQGEGKEGLVLSEEDLRSAGLEEFAGCREIIFYEDGTFEAFGHN